MTLGSTSGSIVGSSSSTGSGSSTSSGGGACRSRRAYSGFWINNMGCRLVVWGRERSQPLIQHHHCFIHSTCSHGRLRKGGPRKSMRQEEITPGVILMRVHGREGRYYNCSESFLKGDF